MSKSFMDAIRGVVTEGSREKTDTGMTKDAKHFIDLHKVQDSGMKHLVQKDSETKDYEKMFSGDVDRAPSNHSSNAPGQDLDKYVEYNEALEILEAKKKERGCDEDCECKDCKDDKKEVKEANMGSIGATDAQRRAGMNITQVRNQSYGGAYTSAAKPAPSAASTGPSSSGSVPVSNPTGVRAPATTGREARMGGNPTGAPMSRTAGGQTKADYLATQKRLKSTSDAKAAGMGSGAMVKAAALAAAKPPGSETAAAASSSTNPANRNIKYTGPDTSKPKAAPVSPAAREPSNKAAPVSPAAREPAAPAAKAPIPKAKPAAPKAAAPKAAAPRAAAPQAPRPSALQRQMQRSRSGRDAVASPTNKPTGATTVKPAAPRKKAPVGTNPLKNSYEFEINGTSYLVSEAHASAIAAFIEKYGMVNEMDAGEFISKEMKHPEKLTAKGKKQKIKQALAIYYSKKRRGENP